jgi:hypothetical protein
MVDRSIWFLALLRLGGEGNKETKEEKGEAMERRDLVCSPSGLQSTHKQTSCASIK